MAGDEGFEPPITGPEPVALPLGQSPLHRFSGAFPLTNVHYCSIFYLFKNCLWYNYSMINRKGFTLVELIVVIIVMAILATIVSLGLNRYLEDGRDSQRISDVTTIVEALEKYYNKYGEYPGCDAMTAAGSVVATNTLKGIDQSALVVPDADASVTNSIRCGTTLSSGGTDGDFIEYVGDGSAECNGSGSCHSYTIRYRNEATSTVSEIESRRRMLPT